MEPCLPDVSSTVVARRLSAAARRLLVAHMLESEDEGKAEMASSRDVALVGEVGLDSSTPAGQLVWHVLAAVASWERAAIAERTRVALAEKRSQGVVLGRPRRMSPETVRRIHDLRSDGLTLLQIADRLNGAEVATPTGLGGWSTSGVRRALRFAQAA
jgi:DNA invertase Pin-like site-specific DNA recombinase